MAGDELRVLVRYADTRAFEYAACEATYWGTTTACRAANFTLGAGVPSYAALSGAALGLTSADLRAVRERYPLDNWYEPDLLALVPRVATSLALGVALGVALAPWWRWYLRPLAAVTAGRLTFAAGGIACGGLLMVAGLVD